MSAKKISIEEKLSQCIFYNLNILKYAVKTTPEFDEHFSSTMFLKSNTKAFIYITHYLFNIIDAKEFKAKFYWPIAEKKAENSYRVASVEFINNLIDKHNLQQEKIKLVFVVHPCGRRFMSMIIDLIMLAIKEVMRRRKIAPEKSFDIEEVTEVCTNMKAVETNLVESIKTESNFIKSKIEEIQNLIKSIFPSSDIPVTFEDFIKSWHQQNKEQLDQINEINQKMNEIYKKITDLHMKATEMLTPKKYSLAMPPPEVVKDVMKFYEDAGAVTSDIPPAADSIIWLISQLKVVLPAITKYLSANSNKDSGPLDEELKVLKRLATDVAKVGSELDDFVGKFRATISPLVEKLQKAKEEQEAEDLPDVDPVKDEMDLESLKLLKSPQYYFDASKDCMKNVSLKMNRLCLMEEDEGKENKNSSKVFLQTLKSPSVNKTLRMNQSIVNHMGPPRQPKKRLDPMEILNRATSRNRGDLNISTRNTGTIPKNLPSPRFSSTMLSPDLRQPFFNCSTISDIGKSPVLSPSVDSVFSDTVKFIVTPAETLSTISNGIPWNDPKKMKLIQTSPKGGLKMLTSIEEVFQAKSFDEATEETIKAADSMESTVKGADSYSCTSLIMINNDEDLFNISDTVLKEIED